MTMESSSYSNQANALKSLYSLGARLSSLIQINQTNKFQSLGSLIICSCSFTEFVPFCIKLYYFSNFKDFNSPAPA